MKVQEKKEDCCGCSACRNVCPKHCITMVEDELGFLYPNVEEMNCIHCGLCQKVCQFVHEEKEKDDVVVYAAKNKDKKIHERSSSGGMFIPLSDLILEQGGAVYGAKFDSNFQVIHGRADTKLERDCFVGSKYVQSNMGTIFAQVEEDLKKSRMVLFSGTACQVHGLLSYLQQKKCTMDHLYTIDIVCHGVPSPKMWREFLQDLQKKKKIEQLTFTSKEIENELKGFKCIYFNGEQMVKGFYQTSYGKLFLNNYNLRESCFQCRYSSVTNRYADITLGDFWGLEKTMPEFIDAKGVSLVLLHTEKGRTLFKQIQSNMEYRKSNVIDCLQPNLKQPSCMPENRPLFIDKYITLGYKKAYHYVSPETLKDKLRKMKKKLKDM